MGIFKKKNQTKIKQKWIIVTNCANRFLGLGVRSLGLLIRSLDLHNSFSRIAIRSLEFPRFTQFNPRERVMLFLKIHVHSVLFWYSLLSRHHGYKVNSKTDLDAMRSDWHSDTYGIIQYIEIWCNQNYLGFSNEIENIVNKNFKKKWIYFHGTVFHRLLLGKWRLYQHNHRW